ncbi:uncharacterized protein LOC142166396 [Nicotiana tabacum]|uniref:Uncharacterized protein LOC142166396 n=1 Tax=Nicotiana tabacum TaxID=4097 RepID=A0AC58S9J4_TOBAC
MEDLKINRITYSPYHPSANGQAESTNKVIIQNIKKSLEAAKVKWTEELPGVLWAYRTTTKSIMGKIPFSLVYGAEALIPVEVNEEANNEALLVRLDLLDEHRLKSKGWKDIIIRGSISATSKVGDLVLRKVTQSTREVNAGMLGPIWEGPYRVSAITGKGSYALGN